MVFEHEFCFRIKSPDEWMHSMQWESDWSRGTKSVLITLHSLLWILFSNSRYIVGTANPMCQQYSMEGEKENL